MVELGLNDQAKFCYFAIMQFGAQALRSQHHESVCCSLGWRLSMTAIWYTAACCKACVWLSTIDTYHGTTALKTRFLYCTGCCKLNRTKSLIRISPKKSDFQIFSLRIIWIDCCPALTYEPNKLLMFSRSFSQFEMFYGRTLFKSVLTITKTFSNETLSLGATSNFDREKFEGLVQLVIGCSFTKLQLPQ
jgi:hypothetical protein